MLSYPAQLVRRKFRRLACAITILHTITFATGIHEAGFAQEAKTSLAPVEAALLNLKPADMPSQYVYNAKDSGLTNDAALFAKGNAGLMRTLHETGWIATDLASYVELDQQGRLLSLINSSLLIYQDAGVLDCRMKDAKEIFPTMGGRSIPTSRKFGDNSHMSLIPVKEVAFPFYHLAFYYGNIYVELVIGGVNSTPEEQIQELEGYAALIERRLADACPQCVQTLPCNV